jgi:hypothetical protein
MAAALERASSSSGQGDDGKQEEEDVTPVVDQTLEEMVQEL